MGEGEGGMIWENGIKTCIISYMKRIASPGSMHDTGCLGLTEMTQRVRGGRREWVQDGEQGYTRGRSMSVYGKTTTIL